MVLPFASAREVGRVVVVILGVSEGGSLMVRRGDADGCVLLVARRSQSPAVDVRQDVVTASGCLFSAKLKTENQFV